MFEISWSELLILAVVTLLFVGPKDLPIFLRTIGRYAGAPRRQAAEFRQACAHACRVGKPVIAIKIGGSEESRRAALAHTGSLAGSLQCFDAVAETVGVIRVDTLDEVVETAEYFSHAPIPKGPG